MVLWQRDFCNAARGFRALMTQVFLQHGVMAVVFSGQWSVVSERGLGIWGVGREITTKAPGHEGLGLTRGGGGLGFEFRDIGDGCSVVGRV